MKKKENTGRAWKCSKGHAYICPDGYVGLACPQCKEPLNLATSRVSGLRRVKAIET